MPALNDHTRAIGLGISLQHPNHSLHQCFESFVDLQPDAPAILFKNSQLSYRQLELQANALANALLDNVISVAEPIGVLVGRSAALPIALLGILKAGGAYVAMVSDHPAARLANIAEQSGMRYLIALDGLEPPIELLSVLAANNQGVAKIFRPEQTQSGITSRPNLAISQNQVAAILFTSGSTGQPKGVLLRHDACVNMAYGHIIAQSITAEDKLLLSSGPGFILGLRELCLPMLSGAAYVPITREELDKPEEVLAIMSTNRVSIALLTPSYLRLFQGKIPNGLRCILTAGEHPDENDARHYAKFIDYWNIYGATEMCGTICMHKVKPDEVGVLPSGKPFCNTAIYLLNEQGQEVALGEIGEIYVVGSGLANGYLNQVELSAEIFVTTPFGRAYKTRDQGRWRADGNLETLGRSDDVIKVSGQSVTLSEIERTFLRHPKVKQAAVIRTANKLFAFIASEEQTKFDWRGYLSQSLPAYMIPAVIQQFDHLPINNSGKLDRRALVTLASTYATDYIPPEGNFEQEIANIWANILKVDRISRHDNFFAMGGTSLLAIVSSQRLQANGYPVTVPALLVNPTVAGLASHVSLATTIAPLPADNLATQAQADFWIATQLGFWHASMLITRLLRIQGEAPSLSAWQTAWQNLLARHCALRTAFYQDVDEKIRWKTLSIDELGSESNLDITYCQSLAEVSELIACWTAIPFDLSKAPLLRARLIQTPETQLFWFAFHHSIVDGLSAKLIQEELFAELQGKTLLAAADGISLACGAEQHYLNSTQADRDRNYWQLHLQSLLTQSNGLAFNPFATDFERPQLPTYKAARALTAQLDANCMLELQKLARLQGVGMHSLLLALLGEVARKRSGRSSLIIGSAISMRPTGAEQAVGLFVNLLPLVLTGHKNQTFDTHLQQAQLTLNSAIQCIGTPSSQIFRDFQAKHPEVLPPSRASIFDITLTANTARISADEQVAFKFTPQTHPGEVNPVPNGVDLAFSHEPDLEGGLILTLAWNPELYRQQTAQAWLTAFKEHAYWLAADIAQAQLTIPALLPYEQSILQTWEWGPTQPVSHECFHQVFENWAHKNPHNPALICEHTAISYAELDQQANGIAHTLLHNNLAYGDSVAVLSDICPELPAVVLGIWKAGGVYLPMATDYPTERLAHMMDDAQARVLIVLNQQPAPKALVEKAHAVFTSSSWHNSPQSPNIPQQADHPAYIIYTSGTTGMPKGVPISHEAMINTIVASAVAIDLTVTDHIALVATPSFDASLWELGLGLLMGAALVPISKGLRDDPWGMKDYYTQQAVTVAFHAPSYLRISKSKPFQGMRVLIVGGEPSSHEDVNIHGDKLAFWHAYGPTETSIIVSLEHIPPYPEPNLPLSVGRPLINTRISIRNDHGQPVPPGVIGEIWLGGLGLSQGYINNPELTASRFIFAEGSRFYRSGDLGLWTDDGRLVIKGRIDHQIKIHGQRIELEEIEKALLALPDVTEALVLVENASNDTRFLRGFVVLAKGGTLLDTADWYQRLATHLPYYMIPATVTQIERIPLTVNGKVDRTALLQLAGKVKTESLKTPPQGAMEVLIGQIWSDLLGQKVYLEDNFFGLGGNSILAVALAHRLSKALAVNIAARLLFTAPTLSAFAARVASTQRQNNTPLYVLEASDIASEGEQEFWLAEQTGLNTNPFLMPVLRKLQGVAPSLAQWQQAWATLVERHEALRTQFGEDTEGVLHRKIIQLTEPSLSEISVDDLSKAITLIQYYQSQPMPLEVAPLWRGGLVHIKQSHETLFWLVMHHAIGDGNSLNRLLAELSLLLQDKQLPPLLSNYTEASTRIQAYRQSTEFNQDLVYWQQTLKALPASVFDDWALDMPRLQLHKGGSHRLQISLPATITTSLKALAQHCDSSLHALMLTLFAQEIRRRSHRSQFLLGTPFDTRETAEDACIIGYFINMLPLLMEADSASSFEHQLIHTQQTLATAMHHGRIPFACIYNDFRKQQSIYRHPSRFPLFDFAVNEVPLLHTDPEQLSIFTRLDCNTNLRYELSQNSISQDMILTHEIMPDGTLMLQLQTNAEIYTQETTKVWLKALHERASWLAADVSHAQMASPKLLPAEEQLLKNWEQGPTLPLSSQCFHEIFADWVHTNPQHSALITEQGIISYAELDRLANGVALALLSQGLVSGDRVAVLTDSCAELPAVLLGIWKAGGVYLPLATDHPPARLAYMLEDAQAQQLVVLNQQTVPEHLAEKTPKILTPDHWRPALHGPDIAQSPDQTAYIIYTSGTTGMPKGVPISHAAMINTIQATARDIALTENDRIALVSSPSFDISLLELGLGLLNGASLVPISKSLRDDPWTMKDYYTQQGVTIALHTPSYLRISKNKPFTGLRVLLVGGEAASHSDIQIYGQNQAFWHAYGPTESSIVVTHEYIPPHVNPDQVLSVGKPLANINISIRDDDGQRVAPGVVAEVWLGGPCLSSGYLNHTDLNTKQFVYHDKHRYYRTGDLGYWNASGHLVIKGRIDHQIKINGQRIELTEIEKALLTLPHVNEALVLMETTDSNSQLLRGFVIMAKDHYLAEPADWYTSLASHLPHYMIPATLTAIDTIPLTANAKIDRAKLLTLVGKTQPLSSKTRPSSPIEVLIAPIWREILGQEVNREDNFFGLGGNSLLAVSMAHRISTALNISVPARDLFAAPTLAAFAARIQAIASQDSRLEQTITINDLATEGEYEFWIAEQAGINSVPFIMPLLRKVQGLAPPLEKWNQAWAKLTERHAALRSQFFQDEQGVLHRIVTQLNPSPLSEISVADLSSGISLVRQYQSQTLSMHSAPLWQAGLVHIDESGETLFWLAMHHAIGDGGSLNILLTELGLLLADQTLVPLTTSYAQSASLALAYLDSSDYKHDIAYWQQQLTQLPETAFAEWALDTPRLHTSQPGHHRLQTCLPADITSALKSLAQRYDSSMHALMLALFTLEIRRRSQRQQFVIGTPADMRETREEAGIMGYYVNMLPLMMVNDDSTISFENQLINTQQTLADALYHGRVPFARIHQAFRTLNLDYRHPSRYPLFDFAVNENPQALDLPAVNRFTGLAKPSGNFEYAWVETSPGQDMVLIHEILTNGELLLQLQVNSAVYMVETASAWFNSLRWWLEWLCADASHAQLPLPKLLPQELAALAEYSYGPHLVRPEKRFHELFEAQVDKLGHHAATHCAVMTTEQQYSYSEVEEQANCLAHALIQSGTQPGDIIGVFTSRSPQLPATILGIWKARAIYLPLSADLPVERICYMINDAAINQLIVLDGLELPSAIVKIIPKPLYPEQLQRHNRERPAIAGDVNDTAYIIYTSGSTGLPKGVLISQQSLVNMALSCGETLGIQADDRCLMFYSPSFDVSLSDIGVPLLFGATICPVKDHLIDSPQQFMQFLNDTQVTVADISPSYLRLFDSENFEYLRILVTGGEAPFAADILKYSAQIRYFNAYGPTENTVTCALSQLQIQHTHTPSCGLPLANTSIHICDASGQLLPPGQIGELWLGGTGLAKGYLGREDLNATSFVETADGRRYRSGDRGRWLCKLPNGTADRTEVQFLGRLDSQIKMNGIRIELGEIEHRISSHPAVFQATVLADAGVDKKPNLSAFIQLRQAQTGPTDGEWREYLAAYLPAATIPTAFIKVDTIPINSSGKVDMASLRRMVSDRSVAAVADNPPQTPMEKLVASIWCELLKLESLQRDDNFFALGGHSLVAIAVAQHLERTLMRPVSARELFAYPTLCDFSRRIDCEAPATTSHITPTEQATTGQQEFWVAEQIGMQSRGGNLTFSIHAVDASISSADWQQAWTLLIDRHPALRTYFKEDANGQLLRQVLPELNVPLERLSFPKFTAAQQTIVKLQTQYIPMSSPPLWQAGLVYIEDRQQEIFWLSLHHAIADGMSIGILLNELDALLAGESLPPVSGDYANFAGRELAYLNSASSATDAAFWQEAIDSLESDEENTPQPFDEWPLDFSRPLNNTESKSQSSHFCRIVLDSTLAKSLKTFANQHKVSLHALIMSILAMETSRRTERPNFVMGTVGSTRASTQDSGVVNYYLNMLPIPCRINLNDSIEATISAMQNSISQALQHDRYPFAQICQDFRGRHTLANHPSRFPLFDLAVTENPASVSVTAKKIRRVPIYENTGNELRYDLHPYAIRHDMLLIHEAHSNGELGLYWYVDANLYEKETALAWFKALVEWLELIVSPQRQPQSALPLLTRQEEKQLASWQYGAALASTNDFLQDQFTRFAARYPLKPALLLNHHTLSYAEIDKLSNGLAQLLRQQGVGPGVTVAVLTERSVNLATTVLAIWKAGGCYLPLSAELPGERLKFIAADARAHLILILDGLALPSELADFHSLRPETLLYPTTAPIQHLNQDTDPAYIIYTSGSTGEPKGVIINFAGYNNFCLGVHHCLALTADDRILQIASPSFDAWLHELGIAWSCGGALAPVTRSELDYIAGMLLKISTLNISVATLSPSYLALFDNAEFPSLRILMTMGEAPIKAHVQHYATRLSYINGYGPSENSIGSCIGQILPHTSRMTAGRPLANTSMHILNNQGQPVPPGSIGVLWLGGRGLSPGYLNRPELTQARFLETAYGRLYNSGDLARWTQDGEIEILGRIDNQVKLRGQRIELEEIEHQICLHPQVLQAAVLIHSQADGTPGLYGFVCLTANALPIDNSEWRHFLAQKLPNYMIPVAIKAVPYIPVSLSGKIDRKRLFAEHLGLHENQLLTHDFAMGKLSPPSNRIEKLIAKAWSEICPGRTIHREDNFFDLGGHSLAVINVVNNLRKEFSCTINDLYEHPVLADFARTCQPRQEHVRELLTQVKLDWQTYAEQLDMSTQIREAELATAKAQYQARNQRFANIDLGPRRDYQTILLTGATGYVGCYLLREMLQTGSGQITALIRGTDHANSLDRLHRVLTHYFGSSLGTELAYHPRLQVLCSDLGTAKLGLSDELWMQLANQTQAIFHCAANVKHYGHYQEFHKDNICSVQNLLELATYQPEIMTDFHLVSTISVVGKPPQDDYKLFTEYDLPNPDLSDNYYVRTKQEAERLILEARSKLNNASIYRVGNVVFASDASNLQINLKDNAFFRLISALIQLGVAPEKVEALFCHVDLVARAILLLADTQALSNETHHIEHAEETPLATFISASVPIQTCDFGVFINYLQQALDNPDQQQAFYEVLEGFNLYAGKAPQSKAQYLELTSSRTNQLLKRLGLEWTDASTDGQLRFLREATLHYKK